MLDATPTWLALESERATDVTSMTPGGENAFALPLARSDPAITHISSSPYVPPFRVLVADASILRDTIFFAQFDSTYDGIAAE